MASSERRAAFALGLGLSALVGGTPPARSWPAPVDVELVMTRWPDSQGHFEARARIATRVPVQSLQVVQGVGPDLLQVPPAPEVPASLPAGHISSWTITGRAVFRPGEPPPGLTLAVQYRFPVREMNEAYGADDPEVRLEFARRRGMPTRVVRSLPVTRQAPMGRRGGG